MLMRVSLEEILTDTVKCEQIQIVQIQTYSISKIQNCDEVVNIAQILVNVL